MRTSISHVEILDPSALPGLVLAFGSRLPDILVPGPAPQVGTRRSRGLPKLPMILRGIRPWVLGYSRIVRVSCGNVRIQAGKTG